MITTIAVTWNFIYNILYEKWEARQESKSRTVKRRIAHAIGFQITLVMFLIPLGFVAQRFEMQSAPN